MSRLEYRKLSDAEIVEGLASVDGWSIDDGKVAKRFEFKTYKDGLVFGIAVGQIADSLNHHPDLEIGYAQVRVAVSTHDVDGISPYDFELAKRVDTLLS